MGKKIINSVHLQEYQADPHIFKSQYGQEAAKAYEEYKWTGLSIEWLKTDYLVWCSASEAKKPKLHHDQMGFAVTIVYALMHEIVHPGKEDPAFHPTARTSTRRSEALRAYRHCGDLIQAQDGFRVIISELGLESIIRRALENYRDYLLSLDAESAAKLPEEIPDELKNPSGLFNFEELIRKERQQVTDSDKQHNRQGVEPADNADVIDKEIKDEFTECLKRDGELKKSTLLKKLDEVREISGDKRRIGAIRTIVSQHKTLLEKAYPDSKNLETYLEFLCKKWELK